MTSVFFENATKTYQSAAHPAVDSLTLKVEPGEFLVMIGPPSSGKSTVLRMLAGLEEVDSGRILLGDLDITKMNPNEREIAIAFQNYALYPHMTVAENMGFPLKIAGLAQQERIDRVLEAAELLALTDYLGDKPKELTGGQRQRVAMARAIVRKPRAFLMDEPLVNLESKLRDETREQIVAMQQKLGITTIYVTQDVSEALDMSGRIAVLINGQLQQVGLPSELKTAPANAQVARYLETGL